MRKLIIILLAILFAFSAAAESDMAGVPTEDLITLRDALNHELALRSKEGTDAQVIDVDGLLISIDSVYIGTGNAWLKAREAVGLEGADTGTVSTVLCCMDGDRAIFKVELKYFFPDGKDPDLADAVWCAEVDCLTGEVTALREYVRGQSSMLIQYVPFSVVDNTPHF